MEYEVISAAVSGKNFSSQIALVSELMKVREKKYNGVKKIDMGLGSSGGNLSIHLLNLSMESPSKLIEISAKLNSKYFARRWLDGVYQFIPHTLGYLYGGTMYKKGIPIYDLYKSEYKEEGFEIWTGTYNIEDSKTQFFCNKSRSQSVINQVIYSESQELFGISPFIYCDNDVKMICDSIIASAAIPFIVPPTKINDVKYGDGGVMYASPLSVLSDEIYRLITGKNSIISNSKLIEIPETDENSSIILEEFPQSDAKLSENGKFLEKSLRLYYIMSEHPSLGKSKCETITDYIYSGLYASSLKDKNSALNLLNMLSPEGVETHKFLSVDENILSTIFDIYSKYKHYVLCLYPHEDSDLNLTKFNGYDVLRNIEKTRKGYGCQIWHSVRLI